MADPIHLSRGARELRARRERAGQSQAWVAELTRKSQVTVGKWEFGKQDPKTVERLILQAVYDIDPMWWESAETQGYLELVRREAKRRPKAG